MASREVRSIRVELPFTAGIFCDVIQQPGKRGFDLRFVQDGKIIHKEMSAEKDADLIVELLVNAQIEFVSFSAVYEAGDIIAEAMDKLEAGEGEIAEEILDTAPTEETLPLESSVDEGTDSDETIDEESEQEMPTFAAVDQLEEESDTDTTSDDTSLDSSEDIAVEEAPAAEKTPPLKEIDVEYSSAIVQLYYDEPAEEFSVAVWDQNDMKLDRTAIPGDEDGILDVLLSANLELQSMSVLFDVASEIKVIADDPSALLKPAKPEIGEEEGEEGELAEDVEPEEELPDVSLLREPGDVETFMEITKKSLQLERQILIREEPIKDMKGTSCKIFRKGENEWFLGFKIDEEESRAKKLPEVDLDEVARAMNNGIPQISFSMLYDAAEELFAVLKRLASRPADDMVIQQTVNHFTQIITEHESEGNLDKAQEVAGALMDKFSEMKKARGYSEFALKVSKYMDDQEKFIESAKLRMQVVDSLHKMGDVDATRDFVEKGLAAMQSEKQGQNLAAAKLAAKLTDILLTEKDISVTDTAMQTINYYKLADLPTSVTEYSVDFGKRILDLGYGDDSIEEISEEKQQKLADKAAVLFKMALKTHDERQDRFELLDTLENAIEWFKECECDSQIIDFSEIGITHYENYNEPEKALELVEDLILRLMSEETYTKALDYVNKAIRIYYEKQDIDSAVEMGLKVVDGLIEIEEKETAVSYLDFVLDLARKAFSENEPEKLQNISLRCVDQLISLGEIEKAVSSVQNAAKSENDPITASEICSKQAMSILEQNNLIPAQELINFGIELLLTKGFHRNAGDMSLTLSNALFDKEQYAIAMSYLDYGETCLQAAEDPDYLSEKLVEHSIKFIDANMAEKTINLIEKAAEYYGSHGELEKGIEAHEKLANKLLENALFDDAFIQVIKGVALFEQIEQFEEASNFLTTFRNKFLEKERFEDARELTDLALKRSVSGLSDHKAGIHIVTPFIEKLVETGDFENGYVYALQNVRYYETLGDIDGATQFVLKYREELLNRELFKDAAEMTSLTIRLNSRHGSTEKAMKFAQEYADLMQEKKQMDLFAEFTSKISDLQRRTTGDEDQAIRTLRESAEILMETAPEESIEVIEKIVSHLEKEDREDATNAYISYVEKLLSLNHLKVSTELAKEVLEYIIEENESQAQAFSLEYASALIEKRKADDSLIFVLYAVGHWRKEDPEKADTIANEHVQRLLQLGEAEAAEKIVQEISSHVDDTGQLTRVALRFVRQLVESGFVENSRNHLDRTIKLLGEKIKSKSDLELASSRIHERFAKLIAISSPDLSREYAYRAADQYRKVKDFEGIARVHYDLSKHLEPRSAVKVLKRGIEKSKGSKTNQPQLMLQKELAFRTITIGKAKESSKTIRKLLEMYEHAEELEESLFTLSEMLLKIIGRGEYELSEDFAEYALKLSQIVGQAAGLNTVLGRLASAYENNEQVEERDRIKEMIHSLPERDTDDELERLGLIIQEEPIELEIAGMMAREAPLPETAPSAETSPEEAPTVEVPPAEPPVAEIPPSKIPLPETTPPTEVPLPETTPPEVAQTAPSPKPEEIEPTDLQAPEITSEEEAGEEFSGAFGALGHLAYQPTTDDAPEPTPDSTAQEREEIQEDAEGIKGFSKLSSLLQALEDEIEPGISERSQPIRPRVQQATPSADEKVLVGPPPPVQFDAALSEIDMTFSEEDLAKEPASMPEATAIKDTEATKPKKKKSPEEVPLKSLRALITSLEEDEEEEW
ncbi:MAG: hypothetical protein ACXACI_03275 [Candidatus Hodarchaeales archaeon]|jgi:hypothetical protein